MTTKRSVFVQLDPEIPEPVEREAFRQAGLEAWADYRKTSLHLDHTATDEWLAKLEAGERVAAPDCHN
ncbi:MAG: hypothetical protein L3J30_14290 [Marinosulfonomonas sp.]|nr:hypothetical protein [Marinosulfonomonas sp.]